MSVRKEKEARCDIDNCEEEADINYLETNYCNKHWKIAEGFVEIKCQ